MTATESITGGPRPLDTAEFIVEAQAERVIDGDTFVAMLFPWFRLCTLTDVRLADVDTHEIYGQSTESEEYKRGKEEMKFTADWLVTAKEESDDEHPLLLAGHEMGKYGRPVVTVVRRADGAILNDDLREEFDDVGY